MFITCGKSSPNNCTFCVDVADHVLIDTSLKMKAKQCNTVDNVKSMYSNHLKKG